MTTTTHHNEAGEPVEDFTTGEGLRTLLTRLHEAGEGAWASDPAARELMAYAAQKYTPLARKHGLDPWEAASAAFDAMQYASTRRADDPWAMVTHGVRITCIFEERAQGLLCSVHQARRPHVSAFHDPERFGDRDNPLTDYHPAFHVTDPSTADTETYTSADAGDSGGSGGGSDQACMSAESASEDAIGLLCLLGWAPETGRASVEHVCGALMRSGTRQSAYESLRRDRHARNRLREWVAASGTRLDRDRPTRQTSWPGEDPAPQVEDTIIADRGEDFVQFVFEQVEARREAEEAFFHSLDERTGEVP